MSTTCTQGTFFKVHPADVLKTRLQLPGAKPGLLLAAQAVWEERGARGFLAGIAPRLVGNIFLDMHVLLADIIAPPNVGKS